MGWILNFVVCFLFFGCAMGADLPEVKSISNNPPVCRTRLKHLANITTVSQAEALKDYLRGGFSHVKPLVLSTCGRYLAWGDFNGNVFLYDFTTGKTQMVCDNTPPEGSQLAQIMALSDRYESSEKSPSESDPNLPDPWVIALQLQSDIQYSLPVKSIRVDEAGVSWLNAYAVLGHRTFLESGLGPSRQLSLDKFAHSGLITQNAIILCERADIGFLRWLITGLEYELRMYDLHTGKFLRRCSIYSNEGPGYHDVHFYALSTDGELLAIASKNNSGLVRMSDFKLIHTFDFPFAQGLAISPDKKYVAIGNLAIESHGEGVVIFDCSTGQRVYKLPNIRVPGLLAFEDNEFLWIASTRELYCARFKAGIAVRLWEGPFLDSMCIDLERRRLILGCADGVVRVYELPRRDRDLNEIGN